MPRKTKPFDEADHLTSAAMIEGYLAKVIASGEPAAIALAHWTAARARERNARRAKRKRAAKATELTTQQAANFLNVSRAYVVELLHKGELPHRMVETHRMVTAGDLIEFKSKSDAMRRAAIRVVVEEAEKLKLP